MLRNSVIILLIFLSFFTVHAYAGPVVGLEELMNDTSSLSVESSYEMVINAHPFFNLPGDHQSKARLHHTNNKTTAFFFALLMLFIFSLARLVFPRYFSNLFQVFTNKVSSKRHIKDQLQNDNRASLWFYIIFFMSTGFIVYNFFILYPGHKSFDKWYINYTFCTSAVLILYGLRTGLICMTGWIFKQTETVQVYLFNKKLSNEFLGLIMFPLCSLILISSGRIQYMLLILSAILYLLMFIFNYLKNMPLLRNLFRISFVHFLLYFCALEVLPVFILIKMIR